MSWFVGYLVFVFVVLASWCLVFGFLVSCCLFWFVWFFGFMISKPQSFKDSKFQKAIYGVQKIFMPYYHISISVCLKAIDSIFTIFKNLLDGSS